MIQDEDKYLDNDDLWDDELDMTDVYTSQRADDDEPVGIHYDEDEDNSDSSFESNDNLNKTDEPDDYYSEHEPESIAAKPKRESFFRQHVDNEDDRNDFFDSDDEPAEIKKPKSPKLDPEDPDYWIDEDESPLTNIIPPAQNNWKYWLAGALAFFGSIIFIWIWFFRPYTDKAVKYGYIINMERRGSLMKTFEGTMIPYKELGDPNPMRFEKVRFSVEGDSLAAVMKRMMLGCVPVKFEYKLYRVPLIWKGEENMIITKADTVDPRKILPPEYQ